VYQVVTVEDVDVNNTIQVCSCTVVFVEGVNLIECLIQTYLTAYIQGPEVKRQVVTGRFWLFNSLSSEINIWKGC